METDALKIYNSNMYIQLRRSFNIIAKRAIHFVTKELQDELFNLNNQQYKNEVIERTLFGDCYFNIPAHLLDANNQDTSIRRALKELQIPIDDKDFIGNFMLSAKREKGCWRLLFPEKSVHFLTEVSKGVTPLQTVVYLSAKSIYTIRLYEVLMQFRDTGIYKVDIEYLCELLGVPEGYKRNTAILKLKTLDVAMKELKELYESRQSEIYFTYKEIRGGRGNKLQSLIFSIIWNQKKLKNGAPIDSDDYKYASLNMYKYFVENAEPKYKKVNGEFMNKALTKLRESGLITKFAKKIEKRVIDNPKVKYEQKGALIRYILEADFNIE